jgi:hypothetical protein
MAGFMGAIHGPSGCHAGLAWLPDVSIAASMALSSPGSKPWKATVRCGRTCESAYSSL